MDKRMLEQYTRIALKRRFVIIIPVLAAVLGGLAYFLNAPKVYESQTVILVQPQRVPQAYVRSIVSSEIEDRLRTITQQITSRTNLEKIVGDFDLAGTGGNLEGLIGHVRQRIDIRVNTGRSGLNSFTISYQGNDPRKVASITDALASNFITENLKIRESQALGTSAFLADELESIRKRLVDKENELKDYREKYMGGLPEQLQTNLRILERLQGQLDQLNVSLRDGENRKILLQNQLTQQGRAAQPAPGGESLPAADGPAQVNALRSELASLQSRYTENHPDVIRLKKRLEELESAPYDPTTAPSGSATPGFSEMGIVQELQQQISDVNIQLRGLRADIQNIRGQIIWYEKKVEDTPKREQELISLNRDYDNLKELYNSMLNRKLEAEIAVSMEKKQKGEQFRVIDPARVPTIPIKPDVKKIFMMTIVLGIAVGGGIAFALEYFNTSYRSPEEIENELKLPILISMPIRHSEKELKIRKIKELMAGVSIAVGFVVCGIGIVIAAKGVDKTLNYLKEMIVIG